MGFTIVHFPQLSTVYRGLLVVCLGEQVYRLPV